MFYENTEGFTEVEVERIFSRLIKTGVLESLLDNEKSVLDREKWDYLCREDDEDVIVGLVNQEENAMYQLDMERARDGVVFFLWVHNYHVAEFLLTEENGIGYMIKD